MAKKHQFLLIDQLCSTWGNIPLEHGKVVMQWYISVALVYEIGKVRGAVGAVLKRKMPSRGLRHPNGSMAKGISVVFLCMKSMMTPLPGLDEPVIGGSCLFPQLSFCFSKTCRCRSA